jgi:hypothetical protein
MSTKKKKKKSEEEKKPAKTVCKVFFKVVLMEESL